MRSLFTLSLLVATSVYACSSNPGGDDGGTDAPLGNDAGNDVTQQQDSGSDAGPQTVTFAYTPQWTTVTAVSVYGGFGQSSDWKMPFTVLTNDGTGTFKGTATLPVGQYLYVFKVTGDDASPVPYRFAVDPTNAAYFACPSTSPTYDKAAPNPCSQLTVPQPVADALVHVKGVVVSDGTPIKDYLVEIERDEKSSHHYFVNRMTTQSDGAYDLMAAPGRYRLQVLHPTFYTKTDVQRDPPTALAALRRDISSPFPLASATVNVPNAEVAFHAYGTFAPTGTATLPTTFTFSGVGTTPTHLDIYGTGMDGGAPSIGDPWYSSTPTSSGTSVFDGGLNTKANTPGVAFGERYFWGVEEDIGTDAGLTWTAQSMVFDIIWH